MTIAVDAADVQVDDRRTKTPLLWVLRDVSVTAATILTEGRSS